MRKFPQFLINVENKSFLLVKTYGVLEGNHHAFLSIQQNTVVHGVTF